MYKERLSECLGSDGLDGWTRSFLGNMQRTFERDGTNTSLSKAQYKKLHQILKLDKETAPTSSTLPRTKPNRKKPYRPRSKTISPLRAIYAPKRAIRRIERQIALPALVIVGLFTFIVSLFEPSTQPTTYAGPIVNNQSVAFVTGSSVNQREGPSTSHRVMGSLSKGTQVEIVVKQASWSKINSTLGEGWMASKYISKKAKSVTLKQPGFNALTARDIRVIDGDTIAVAGLRANVRLVGFNTPETYRAQCARERSMGVMATSRLRGLISSADRIEFQQVACACSRGTQGTKQCNYGRLCGTLAVDGSDVGRKLINEGLAVAYRCGRTRCPPKPGRWCG